jgi:IS1 family transposase
VQCDEKWSFVGKKRRRCDRCDPADHDKGDCWDHVAFDAEHKLVLGVVVGRRDNAAALALMHDLRGRVPELAPAAPAPTKEEKKHVLLLVTDGYLGYPTSVRLAFAGAGGSPPPPPPGLTYAVVRKRYDEHGHVAGVERQAVCGTTRQLGRALAGSPVSAVANTAFVERHNATDRHRNARKARRTYRFSKSWRVHAAVTYFTYYTYNFCCPVRTLRRRRPDGTHEPRTPAMSAGLADHVWPLREWLRHVVTGISS